MALVMTYSKMACRAVASPSAAESMLDFGCFPDITYNSLAFAAWQVANN